MCRLFIKLVHTAIFSHAQHTKGLCRFGGYLDTTNGESRVLRDVIRQHRAVVHFVNVVAGQHNDVAWIKTSNNINILVHGVGGALVPGVFIYTLLRGKQFYKWTEIPANHAPASLNVAYQRVRLILSQHPDSPYAGVQTI